MSIESGSERRGSDRIRAIVMEIFEIDMKENA